MVDPIRELKVRAELLQKRLERGEPRALARLRSLPEHRTADDGELERARATISRKHCLAVVSRELGFVSYAHAVRVVDGDEREDFGKALYPVGVGGLNVWTSSYDEARSARDANEGFLLPYVRQFVVVGPAFIEELGLDPSDPDFVAIGFDWARPRDREARRRLYGKLFVARPRDAA